MEIKDPVLVLDGGDKGRRALVTALLAAGVQAAAAESTVGKLSDEEVDKLKDVSFVESEKFRDLQDHLRLDIQNADPTVSRSKYTPHQGKKEMARRVRQMEKVRAKQAD